MAKISKTLESDFKNAMDQINNIEKTNQELKKMLSGVYRPQIINLPTIEETRKPEPFNFWFIAWIFTTAALFFAIIILITKC